MRNNKQILLTFLLIFVSPSIGVIPSSGRENTGVQVNHEDAEWFGVSPDIIEPSSWTSSLGRVPQSMQYAYLPSAVRMTGAVQDFIQPESSPADFWEKAKEAEQNLQNYVHSLLEAAAAAFKSTKFTEVTSAMHNIVNATAIFRVNIKDALDTHQITGETLTEELESIFTKIVDDLKKIPAPDKAPGHAERTEMVDKVLDDTSEALLKLAARYGIEEEAVTKYMLALKPHMHALMVAIGDINEQHPELLPALAFSVAVLLIPESWILRPFLSVFGFGPAGPVKGSLAAWMQRRFWGAAVRAGSWFAWLQAAGMGKLPNWAGLVTKLPWLIGTILALLLPCLHCGS